MDNQLDQQLKRLPNRILQYISSESFSTKLSEILRNYSIDEEDKQYVREEVYFMILGITDPFLIIENLQLAGLLDEDEAGQLSEEINDILLEPIAPELADYWIAEIDRNTETDNLPTELSRHSSDNSPQRPNLAQVAAPTIDPYRKAAAEALVTPQAMAAQALSQKTVAPLPTAVSPLKRSLAGSALRPQQGSSVSETELEAARRALSSATPKPSSPQAKTSGDSYREPI